MKKILLFLLLSISLIGCKSKSVTETKVKYDAQRMIRGDWKITKVSFAGSDVLKIKSFDIDDSQCFVGSKWHLIANNNKGNFELIQCSGYKTEITWFINKEGQFVMKLLDDVKAKKVKEGYVLSVANITDISFQLVDAVNIAGKSSNVVYQFEKLN